MKTREISPDDQPFGTLKDGREARLYTLRNASGLEAKISNYGGVVVSLTTPDRNGNLADVVLGYDDFPAYQQPNPYFGALIGRFANRIKNGRFVLDGKEYQLPVNNASNTLHGGFAGLDKVLWQATPHLAGPNPSLELSYLSPDGEEGFPGNVEVTAIYTLTEENELRLDLRATTDQPTIVNLTHHSYFHLEGHGSGAILDHEIVINAEHFLPVDANLIPTGELRPVAGTPFDFRTATTMGARVDGEDEQLILGKGYDHCWVITKNPDELALAAKVSDPTSGRVLEVFTTAPGVQFYSGNFLDGSCTGKGDARYNYRSGFCLEPQHFPDTPNHPHFPSATLRPGETYTHTMVYRFRTK